MKKTNSPKIVAPEENRRRVQEIYEEYDSVEVMQDTEDIINIFQLMKHGLLDTENEKNIIF